MATSSQLGETPDIAETAERLGALPDASTKLIRVAELAREFHCTHVAEEAASLSERITEGRFYVACIGQFKRGKSTLLNALVKDRVLPTGVVPITTVPTIVRFGPDRRARIRFESGTWTYITPEELTQYVSEEHNPENAKHVSGVEVFLPSDLLADGMCLVDTPGLGSVFIGNTAATQGFVPHIDAAIVVVGADPPIAGDELAMVEEVGRQVRQLIVVLNKADRTTDAERRIAIPFTRTVLEKRLGRSIGPIFEVSAHAQQQQPGWDWDKFQSALQKLADESGQTLVRQAAERGVRRLSEKLLTVIFEEREALLRPVEESERRIASMQQTIAETDQSMREFGYLFTAEQHRLSDLFLERRKQFLSSTMPEARVETQKLIWRIPRQYGPRFRRDAMRTAQTVAARHVLPWLATEQARAETEYRVAAGRFVNIGNEFLQRLAATRIPELARMPNALDTERGFRIGSRFHFEELTHVAQPASPLRYVADIFLGLAGLGFLIEKQALAFFEYLLEMNSSRVQSDLLDRVQDSRGQLETEIRKLLHEVTRMAKAALGHAQEARTEGTQAVEAKLADLRDAENEIQRLLSGETGVGIARNGNGNDRR